MSKGYALKKQLVDVNEVRGDYFFTPHWEEVHPSLQWAWLVTGAHFEAERGEEDVATYLEAEFVWAYSKDKPIHRNKRGEFADGVGYPATPYRHFPSDVSKRSIYVPLGIDYRQVLVERPQVSKLTNRPDYAHHSVSEKTQKKINLIATNFRMSETTVIERAIDRLYQAMVMDEIVAEKVE